MGVEYEIVKESWPSRKGRTAVIEGTGQSGLPAIELENGNVVPRAVRRHGEGDPRREVRRHVGHLTGAAEGATMRP